MNGCTLLIIALLSLTEPVTSEKCEGSLKNNLRHGHWKCFYADGVLQQEGDYKEGKKEGTWKLFHANGILAGEGVYLNDQEKGKWKFYDDEGKLLFEQEY
jgi:uncharacterized protein